MPSRIGEGISTWALASIRLVSGDAAARLLGKWNREGGCKYPICRFDFDPIKYLALAWANDSVDPQLSTSMITVRNFGEQHGFDELTTKKWHAHEVDGWEMASIAVFPLKSRGAYRTSKGPGFTFMIMTDVHWAT